MTIKKAKARVAPPANAGKVRYKYIPRRVYGITNPKHVLYDGKNASAIDTFYVKRDKTGKRVLNLTVQEKGYIKQELVLTDEDLNVNDRNNEYLATLLVEMPKAGLHLDTTDAYQLLQDKILQAYDNVMAPNSKAQKNKRSYRYVRLEEGAETSMFMETADEKKKVYKLLGKLEESRERMIMYVLYTKVRLDPRIKTADLKKMVNLSADKEPSTFIKTLEDPLFTEKGILNMGVSLKVVEIKSGFYYFDDLPIAHTGSVANLQNAATYLADKGSEDIKLAISEKVLNEFNRIK